MTQIVKKDVEGFDVANLSADLVSEIDESGVLGYSEKSEDSLIPIIAILQDNSGEVKKKHSRQMEGAEPGMLIVRSLKRIFPAEKVDEAVAVQPCGFDHVWVEWQGEPGEGAVVGQYAFESPPESADEIPDPQNPDRKILVMPNGNRLVDTRYHYVNLLLDDAIIPAVVAMGGTNHTVSRQWTLQMRQARLSGGRRAPSFFRKYRLTTQFKQRGEQSWYMYSVTDDGWIRDENLLRAGLELAQMVDKKIVSVAAQDEGEIAEERDSPI